ncbi:hypothetical protein [Microbacterium arborescens]
MSDPHDLTVGGHDPVDVDPFIPTGRCAVCEGVRVDERVPEDRGPDNPYDPGAMPEVRSALEAGGPAE